MKTILIASSNAGKIAEMTHYLADFDIQLISQKSYNIQEVPETGLTFIENALIKARNAAEQAKLPVLADDSGIVIKALNGRPGIYSARYAGNDHDNNAKVLLELKNIPWEKRQAYFYCCMVLLRHAEDPAPIIAIGQWHGYILEKSQGEKGFGYDPIFYVPEKKLSAAELTLTEKNKMSHRGQALKQLQQQIQENELFISSQAKA